ncbi:MAG: hypothetical protein WD200_05310 [Candidatus Andersenbacteria bacterium]
MPQEFKQSTIGDIIDSEREMFLTAGDRYGEYFSHASALNTLLNNFIKSVDDPEKFLFMAYLSSVKKHHTLALLSTVRLHSVQAGMDLRQVIEAGAWAAYAMAFKEKEKFCEDEGGVIEIPKKLLKARNTWFDQEFKGKSDELEKMKGLINGSFAHANFAYTFQHFKFVSMEEGFHTPFFDFEDDHHVKGHLWWGANIAMGLLDLFYGVNKQYQVVQFVDEFLAQHQALTDQNNRLKAEMMNSERFKKAQQLS